MVGVGLVSTAFVVIYVRELLFLLLFVWLYFLSFFLDPTVDVVFSFCCSSVLVFGIAFFLLAKVVS